MVRCSDLDFNHTSVACDECWEREKIAMRHRENTEKMDKLVLLFDALVDKNVLQNNYFHNHYGLNHLGPFH